jgi:hypothetical protein
MEDFLRKLSIRSIVLALAIQGVLTIASESVDAQARIPPQRIQFSSYTWTVRQTALPEGPMNNYFAGKDISVFVNPDSSLTLRLSKGEEYWNAAEVILTKRLGYGTYIFRLKTPPATLDSNVVLGFFTYSSNKAYHHSEIDIEFSAWGSKKNPVLGQYVVQPYDNPNNIVSFNLSKIHEPASYSFTWSAERIEFTSWYGYGSQPVPNTEEIIYSWVYNNPEGIPKPGREFIHMNLYLTTGGKISEGAGPAGNGLTAVTIDSFEFIPPLAH